MADILNLNDSLIPISKRYDDFLLWSHEHPSIIPEVIAENLGVEISVVNVFHQLGEFEQHFQNIDEKKVSVDSLFLLVRYDNPEVWEKVFEQVDVIQGDSQPMNALRMFIEKIMIPDYYETINNISAKAFASIAKTLKARNITSGTINKSFRGMLVLASKNRINNERISNKMCDWIMRAINRDVQNELGIFNNEDLLNNYTEDYNYFEVLITQLPQLTNQE